ncbi:Glyoxylase, beta-lactamase superfamily II [Propionispira arboris]|uniref:Glyoxylase, beta-lactamase superfamily II n=1 Tax=Propionispira arboris TaxID=84035 RepID=A0A1H6WJ93_9FIRM|nr:Glyoxylase, beta-lactamase superfamily II [Propionispira arboris]
MKVHSLIVGELGVNCYIVACEKTKEAIVIDPGDEPDRILQYIEDEHLNIKYVVNTHGHADHIGANDAIVEATQAVLKIHEGDLAMLGDAKQNLSAFHGLPVLSNTKAQLLHEGDQISFGEEKLIVLHTPGHSPGGICLAGRQILFSGDSLFAESVGRCDFPGGSMTDLIYNIKTKLMILDDDTVVYPGHGPRTKIGWERKDNPYLSEDSRQ